MKENLHVSVTENERYIERKTKNMLAMSQKKVIVFDNFAVEIPDMELAEGLGFEWEKKCRKIYKTS